MIIRPRPRTTCLLCGRALKTLRDGRQEHPIVADCQVTFTDQWGVSLDDEQPIDVLRQIDRGFFVDTFTPVDVATLAAFTKRKLPRLGGPSTGFGWSSFGLFQRCQYAWKLRYVDRAQPLVMVESPALAVGGLFHTFIALWYMKRLDPSYGISPEELHAELAAVCNPAFVAEAWRVFRAYALHYKFEEITPLALEYDLVDPRTNESCRYDMIAYIEHERPNLLPGTYVVEHKTASRFDYDTLLAWPNEGEVLGQIDLWERLKLEKRFGPLQGVIINITGKQKDPQFHRTIVAPSTWAIDSHRDDLRRWNATMQIAKATNSFPRSRRNCVDRYGRCDWYDHCATGERIE